MSLPSEADRLAALHALQILDTPPETAFDRITGIAAEHYGVPIALVSLVDDCRQWFKSRHGLEATETRREVAFCARAIGSDEPFIVNDATVHPDFADNPLVTGPPHVRFYAGCPLITQPGIRVGTLCIIDHAPRPEFGRGDTGILAALAGLVVDEMELRLARARAEADSRAKSGFIATMSHELRTPMTAVMGYAELLADSGLDERQGDYVHHIRESGSHLVRLLNDMLDLSRIEAGRLQLAAEPFPPAALVAQVVALFDNGARERGLDLRAAGLPGAREVFRGDATRIRQMLVNLVSNAIKFTDEGRVEVRAGLGEADDGRRELRLEVADTGIGIPEEFRLRLFERFAQADESDGRRHYGAGLGLAICRELAVAMGGSIAARAREEGPGSVFSVTIPEARPAA